MADTTPAWATKLLAQIDKLIPDATDDDDRPQWAIDLEARVAAKLGNDDAGSDADADAAPEWATQLMAGLDKLAPSDKTKPGGKTSTIPKAPSKRTPKVPPTDAPTAKASRWWG